LAKVCRSKKDSSNAKASKKPLSTHAISEKHMPEERYEYSFTIQDTKGAKDKTDSLYITMTLNGKEVPMEIDTSSAVSIMAETKFKEISSNILQESQVNLCTYSGEKINVKGEAMCNIEYEGKSYVLPMVIISGEGLTLLGRS